MNEWEFTQLAATWMQQAIDADPRLIFRHARTEQTTSGSIKRRDLTLLDAGHKPLLTGEVKMPYQPEGNSPYRYEVVRDARNKAKRAKCEFCFTWNVNRLVLWSTLSQVAGGKLGTADDAFHAWEDIVGVYRPDQMELETVQAKIKRFLVTFLREADRIVRGEKKIGGRKPDDKFVGALEAALEQPILLTTDALAALYKRSREREALQTWMRNEQGWILADPIDARGTLDNLTDAARFANYALMNKVVFHEALVRRYPHDLNPIAVPEHISSGDQLRTHLEGCFQRARDFTRDYETVFGEHQYASVAIRIPFYADPAVVYSRELVAQIHEFDFSKLDYEVIGKLFEHLISPEERHKYGQYYTRAEVVDLINSFCIQTGRERVMDPACGGGTFLVRAYARKKELNPAASHLERLQDLYGIDLSLFATNLTTINLATRDLISDENYPQVARSDFFDVEPTRPLMNLPARITAVGLGSGQSREVRIQPLDAIVGNPPYVRQEHIPSTPNGKNGTKNGPKSGTKEFYQLVAQRAAGMKFTGRSDLHVYFWPHAAEFLHSGGWLCLLTSSQWLDVDYGFRLQEYILRNFEIHAIFESVDEPWFVGARVVTCVTILRRARDEETRMNHGVRFVQLRRPIADVLAHDGTTAGAMAAADLLRDAVLTCLHNTATKDYRVRVISQGDLWRDGVRIGGLVKGKRHRGRESQPPIQTRQSGHYFGGKWGQYVRAPEIWFRLTDHCRSMLAPLADLAGISRGVTSGNDNFFLPIDVSNQMLTRYVDQSDFEQACGVKRRAVEKGSVRIVQCGENLGEIKPIEASMLEPEVHNLKDAKHFDARAEDCRRTLLLTGKPTNELPPLAQAYIKWGEENGWHEKSTAASRQTAQHAWHDLTVARRGAIFWSMRHGYRHVVLRNRSKLRCNKSFFDITSIRPQNDALWGILNSTIVLLSKINFGHPIGVEGYLETEVFEAKMMLVPDLRNATAAQRKEIASAMRKMSERRPLNLISPREFNRTKYELRRDYAALANLSNECELDQPDRRNLDEAVLRMLGFSDADERTRTLEEIYSYLREHFIQIRRKEEKANENKKKAKKRGRGSTGTIAQELIEQLRRESPEVFRRYPQHFIDAAVLAAAMIDTFDVPPMGAADQPEELLNGKIAIRFRRGKRTVAEIHPNSMAQAQLLWALVNQNMRGMLSVPHDPSDCDQVRKRFIDWVTQRDEAVQRIVERQTADEDMQQSLRDALIPMTCTDLRTTNGKRGEAPS